MPKLGYLLPTRALDDDTARADGLRLAGEPEPQMEAPARMRQELGW